VKIDQVPSRKLFGAESGPDPNDIDRAMDTLAIDEWHSNSSQAIVDGRTTIAATKKRRISQTITLLTGLLEDTS
jgi:hypothetical protein